MSRRSLVWISLAMVALLLVGGAAWWLSATAHRRDHARSGSDPSFPADSSTAHAPPAAPRPRGKDSSAELNRILTETNPGTRSENFGRLLRQWFKGDPEAALAYLRTVPRGAEYTNGLLIVLGGIAENDPGRALDLAREMATTADEWILYNALFDRLAEKDVTRALLNLEKVPPGGPKTNALRALISQWATTDPDAAWNWSLALADNNERSAAIESALAILSRNDPARCVALADQFLAGEARDRMLVNSLRKLTELDPQAARGIVDHLPPGQLRSDATLDVVRAIASQDTDAALAWIASFGDETLRNMALRNLLDVWSITHPEQAQLHISSMAEGQAQDTAAAHLATLLATADPAASFAWVDTLKSESARNAAFIGIASAWARTDSEAATRWAASFPENSMVRDQVLGSTLSFWALADPAAAGAFIASLPEDEQPSALLTVAPSWAQADIGAALEWAKSLTNPDIRDIALDSVVTRWADNSPEAAARWVVTEPETPARVDQVRTITRRWLTTDGDSALAWVNTLSPGPTRDGAADVVAEQLSASNPTLARSFATSIRSTPLREARLEQLATAGK